MEGLAQHNLLIKEANRRGIHVKNISKDDGKLAHELSTEDQSAILVQGIVQKWGNPSAELICDQKQLTKELFKTLKIPTPESLTFKKPQDMMDKIILGESYVCKPSMGTNGFGVQMGIGSMHDIESYYQTYGHLCKTHLLEKFVKGYDLRLQIIDSKIVAACLRLPAYVMGNGKSSLQQLISCRRKEIKAQNQANGLIMDQQSLNLLDKQQILLKDIIPLNKKIQLKKVANMAQGGHAVDVTDKIDPDYHRWVESIATALNISYFALDIITDNHRHIENTNTFALEINSRAEWMHHTFSERKTHDLAGIILDVVFGDEI